MATNHTIAHSLTKIFTMYIYLYSFGITEHQLDVLAFFFTSIFTSNETWNKLDCFNSDITNNRCQWKKSKYSIQVGQKSVKVNGLGMPVGRRRNCGQIWCRGLGCKNGESDAPRPPPQETTKPVYAELWAKRMRTKTRCDLRRIPVRFVSANIKISYAVQLDEGALRLVLQG
jgi:hypothetical protein